MFKLGILMKTFTFCPLIQSL